MKVVAFALLGVLMWLVYRAISRRIKQRLGKLPKESAVDSKGDARLQWYLVVVVLASMGMLSLVTSEHVHFSQAQKIILLVGGFTALAIPGFFMRRRK